MGILLRFGRDGWNPPTAHAAPPPRETFIIVVTLGARSGPGGPQTFPWRASPGGGAMLPLVVMNLRRKTVKFLLMLRDGSGPPASMLRHCPVITLQYPWGRGSGPREAERWEAELQSNTFRGAEAAFSLKNQHPQLLCFHRPP